MTNDFELSNIKKAIEIIMPNISDIEKTHGMHSKEFMRLWAQYQQLLLNWLELKYPKNNES